MSETQEAGGIGHNSGGLSQDDLAALHLHYTLKVRRQQAEAAEAKAAYDALRTEVNGTFKLISKDLRIKRKDFELDLQLADLSAGEFTKQEAARRWRLENLGCPVGAQMSLPLDVVDDKELAYQDGFRCGRRADEPNPPEKIATYLQPDWMRGWHDGQAANVPGLARAAEILAAREAAAAESEDDDGQTDVEDLSSDADGEEFDPAAEARKLEEAGFLEPSGEGSEDDSPIPGLSEVFPGVESEAAEEKAAKRSRRRSAAAVH